MSKLELAFRLTLIFYSPLPSGNEFGNSILILILNRYPTALATLLFLNLCHNDGFVLNVIDSWYSSTCCSIGCSSINSCFSSINSCFSSTASATTCDTVCFSSAFYSISSVTVSSITISTGLGITFNASATSIPI